MISNQRANNLFDAPIDRRGSDATKWRKYAGQDILPLWVADMDFAAPPAVQEALRRRLEHGVFGYPHPPASLTEAVLAHLEDEYRWKIDPAWLIWLPGLVTGLNVACRAVEGSLLTATPVYPPFLSAPRFSGRPLKTLDLICGPEGWRWDWAALEAAAPGIGQLLLCHPHNPVGRAWTRKELETLATFAERHDWIVCSDEIHCGLMLEDRPHLPFATLSDDAARRSITLMAPSKTFNVPGLGCAFAIIPNPDLRRRFHAAMEGIVPHVNAFGLAACEAAYREGAGWRRELLAYLRTNRDTLENAVARLPGISMTHVEATYLAWINVRELGLAHPQKHFETHGLGLSDGADFGAPGWLRLNFGCTRATLDQALTRLVNAVL